MSNEIKKPKITIVSTRNTSETPETKKTESTTKKRKLVKRKVTATVNNIQMYDIARIEETDAEILSGSAYQVKVRNDEGKVIPVSIISLENAYAVLRGSTLEWVCSMFSIVRKVRTSNNTVYVEIRKDDESGENQFRIPMSYLTSDGFKNLVDYDIHVNRDYYSTMTKFFQMKLNELSMESAEQQVGFQKNANVIRFIGYDDNTLKVNNTFQNFYEYLDKLNSLICDSVPIQYALTASMSAAVMTILNIRYRLDIHSYIIDFVGASSTGKTLTAKLCASMWTNPSDDSIFTPMFATKNALYKKISGRFGVPVFFDEAGMSHDGSTHEFLYSIYEQREKGRLNTDCTDKVSGKWNTIICITSEQRYHSKNNSQNGGLSVRIHYADSLNYTKSIEHADEIKLFANYNYGILGKEFVSKLINCEDDLLTLYKEAKEVMKTETEQAHCEFTDRMVENFAVTLLTARILAEMGLKLDCDGIIRIMSEQNCNVADEWNVAKNALRAISEYYVRLSFSSEIRDMQEKYVDSEYMTIAVTERLTKEILSNAGFQNIEYAIKQMDKKGYIKRQGSGKGLKSKLNFGGQSVSCYMFKLKKAEKTSINLYDILNDVQELELD